MRISDWSSDVCSSDLRRPNAAAASDVPKVGWWPYSYDASFASVRIRCLHPLAQLRRNGYTVEFFNPKNASSYDAVLFSEHLSQKSLHAAQELRQSGVRILFDLCYNHFHHPMTNLKRQEKAERLRQFIEMADKVVVSTEALTEVVLADRKSVG